MALVRLTDVNVRIPIYDSHALRLIRLPAFGRAKVGTQAISHSGAVLIIHALNSLNLELHEGDRVSLIGHNGAGKTTLLRVLAGIYPSSTGKVEVVGKVFALLGNSMMMNPDATGYETIRLVTDGAYAFAVGNVVISVVACLVAVFAAASATQWLWT